MVANRRRSRGGLRLWPFWAALASVVLLSAAVAVVAGLTVWFVLGRPPVARPAPLNAAGLLDLTRIALVVTGGIGGVVALVVAYRRQRLHEQADTRESGKLFNERFIAASAQLGHDSAAVRLAGVYAMAELADDSPDHLHPCVDVLCAYLRLPYVPESDAEGWKAGEREVRLSIIRVIGDHLRPSAPAQAGGTTISTSPAPSSKAAISTGRSSPVSRSASRAPDLSTGCCASSAPASWRWSVSGVRSSPAAPSTCGARTSRHPRSSMTPRRRRRASCSARTLLTEGVDGHPADNGATDLSGARDG